MNYRKSLLKSFVDLFTANIEIQLAWGNLNWPPARLLQDLNKKYKSCKTLEENTFLAKI